MAQQQPSLIFDSFKSGNRPAGNQLQKRALLRDALVQQDSAKANEDCSRRSECSAAQGPAASATARALALLHEGGSDSQNQRGPAD